MPEGSMVMLDLETLVRCLLFEKALDQTALSASESQEPSPQRPTKLRVLKMKQVFLDLDGVMADFDSGFPRIFGVSHQEIEEEEMWRYVASRPSYFFELDPMPGALDFYRRIEALSPIILTACPKVCFAEAALAKRRWVREHLSTKAFVLPVWGGKNKPLYMHEPGDILIDDWAENIKVWNLAGGVGIHHVNFDDTFNALTQEFQYAHSSS